MSVHWILHGETPITQCRPCFWVTLRHETSEGETLYYSQQGSMTCWKTLAVLALEESEAAQRAIYQQEEPWNWSLVSVEKKY